MGTVVPGVALLLEEEEQLIILAPLRSASAARLLRQAKRLRRLLAPLRSASEQARNSRLADARRSGKAERQLIIDNWRFAITKWVVARHKIAYHLIRVIRVL